MARHMESPVPSARVVRKNVPEAVDAALARALSKVAQDRFPGVAAFAEALGGAAPTVGHAAAGRHRVRSGPRSLGTSAAGALVLAAALLAGWFLLGRGRDPGPTRLVVLPFENHGNPEQTYFAEGIVEEITSALAGIGSLGVIGRTSARQYLNSDKTARQISEELDVGYLIEGSVRWYGQGKAGDTARVTARLLRAADGEELWSDAYDVARGGAIQVQADIAEEVARALNVVLLEPEQQRLAEPPTASGEAYDFLWRGNAAYDRSWAEPDVMQALQMYQDAVDLDPGFALGWAKLSRTHSWVHQLRLDLGEDRLVAAKVAADRAVALDSKLPDAHIALGLYYYWGRDNFERALEELEIARELKPSDAQVFLQIGNIRRRQGRFSDAITSYRRSAELDPKSHRAWFNLGETLLFMREYADARPALQRATELAPDFLEAYVQLARLAINADGDVEAARTILRTAEERIAPTAWRATMLDFARIIYNPQLGEFLERMRPGAYGLDSATYYVMKGTIVSQTLGRAEALALYDSARVRLEAMREEQPGQAWIHGLLGRVYAGVNRPEEAIRSGQRALQLLPVTDDALDGPEWLINLANVYVMLGRMDRAADCYNQALAIPSWISVNSLRTDPLLAPLRETAQFRQLSGRWSRAGGASGSGSAPVVATCS